MQRLEGLAGTSRPTATYDVGNGSRLIGHLGYQKLKKQRARSRDRPTTPQDSITDWKLGATYDLERLRCSAPPMSATNRDLTGGHRCAQQQEPQQRTTVVVGVTKTF